MADSGIVEIFMFLRHGYHPFPFFQYLLNCFDSLEHKVKQLVTHSNEHRMVANELIP